MLCNTKGIYVPCLVEDADKKKKLQQQFICTRTKKQICFYFGWFSIICETKKDSRYFGMGSSLRYILGATITENYCIQTGGSHSNIKFAKISKFRKISKFLILR